MSLIQNPWDKPRTRTEGGWDLAFRSTSNGRQSIIQQARGDVRSAAYVRNIVINL